MELWKVGGLSVVDSDLAPQSPATSAELQDTLNRGEYSPLQFIELVFQPWLDEHILPHVNQAIHAKRDKISASKKKFYRAVDNQVDVAA